MFVLFAVIFCLFGVLFGLWSRSPESGKRVLSVITGILAIAWGMLATIFVFGALNKNIPAHAPFLLAGILPWLVGYGLRWLIDGPQRQKMPIENK